MNLPPDELVKVFLAIGGVLVGTVIMVGLLLWMALALHRSAARKERAALASWSLLAQECGLPAPVRQSGGLGMKGIYDGRELSVSGYYGITNSRKEFTFVSVKVKFPLDVYLHFNQDRTSGVDYVTSGSPELDQRFFFLSRPPDLLRQVVEDVSVRQALDQAKIKSLTATPYEIFCFVAGIEQEQQRLRGMIELVSSLARLLETSIKAGRLAGAPPQEPEAYKYLEQAAPPIRISI